MLNKEYDLNFNPEKFHHIVEFNKNKSQIEMYLKANSDLKIKAKKKIFILTLGIKFLQKLVENFQIILLIIFLKFQD